MQRENVPEIAEKTPKTQKTSIIFLIFPVLHNKLYRQEKDKRSMKKGFICLLFLNPVFFLLQEVYHRFFSGYFCTIDPVVIKEGVSNLQRVL
jgi:hypothetical protein